MSVFSFTRKTMSQGGRDITWYSLPALQESGYSTISSFPRCVKVLLESVLRMQGHPAYTPEHVERLANWSPDAGAQDEFPFLPSRVLLQDFTGVPCVVDLAALRSAMTRAGGDPRRIEPDIPVDLIIDHSVQLDKAGSADALAYNIALEFERNTERYIFLRWGQSAFERLQVLPPGLGICHQVNVEHLATCVTLAEKNGSFTAFPDSLVGTDSHTPTVNSLGVVGWGVGGIEAEAAMLGQPIPILTPVVTGVRLTGRLDAGSMPTDIALRVTERLREAGVVGQFVEFFGSGLDELSLADRAPIANMSPEYGATMGFFPIDEATLQYLRETGRNKEQVDLVARYAAAQGLTRATEDPIFNRVIEIDLGTIRPSISGPRRPQERQDAADLHKNFTTSLSKPIAEGGLGADEPNRSVEVEGRGPLQHGSVVIASITSCTNTSTPRLMITAGLMARKAVELGLTVPATVKTSLAPGSQVVTDYLSRSGLLADLEKLGFQVAAYGCATCIGNSGPLAPEIEKAITDNDLVVAGVLSGNRNFEGRVHPLTRANYLCSPPLVLAYALKGRVNGDIENEPLGTGLDGQPVYLRDLQPDTAEVQALIEQASDPALYEAVYSDAPGPEAWQKLPAGGEEVFTWEADSTYIQEPPFFQDFPATAPGLHNITGARVLGLFGDFITTDHISPAGAIPADSPAARYLLENGVEPAAFNSFGSRRGNHEVMMRGTFGNIRLRNQLVNREGGYTLGSDGEETSMYDAAMAYINQDIPLTILAGKMYGAGSSRDWAAKGTKLLGVRMVIAESYERIHRSNLVEMGVVPLEFTHGETASSLGLDGSETFDLEGLTSDPKPGMLLQVIACKSSGEAIPFTVKARIDSPIEFEYLRHGGILDYVLRQALT